MMLSLMADRCGGFCRPCLCMRLWSKDGQHLQSVPVCHSPVLSGLCASASLAQNMLKIQDMTGDM